MASASQKAAGLATLAAAHGVMDSYIDARGQRQHIAACNLRRLLAALGVDTGTPQRVAQSLEQVQDEESQRTLPPSLVLRRGQSVDIPVTLPEGTPEISWQVEREDGRVLRDGAEFARLPLLETRQLGARRLECRMLRIAELPMGYHGIRLNSGAFCHLIITPDACWLPGPREDGRRLWGLAVQLPLLRSDHNWGVGDFTDLAKLVRHACRHGLDVVGINPLHAGFVDAPGLASPYSPSSRLLLNVIFIDVMAVPGLAQCAAAQEQMASPAFVRQLTACREAKWIDYGAVMVLKLAVLRLLYRAADREDNDWQAFSSFRAAGGTALRRACLFQVIREQLRRGGLAYADWRFWPQEFRNPDSPGVRVFAAENAEELGFQLWLQWQAERQLADVKLATGDMRIGLYRDLAVGTDPSGAECWSAQEMMLPGLRVGAPPDLLKLLGQDWGISSFDPRALREQGYRGFIELLRANMRHAGALRIDHVMALQRLWCLPEGASAAQGAYLRYPFADLLGIVALESQRHRCMVVGEDLGTVPEGFRERLHETQILSYRVLHFERDSQGSFLPPEHYPRLAVAVAGNHDLPTLKGWLLGRDLAPASDAKGQERRLKERERHIRQLKDALRSMGVLRPASSEPETFGELSRAVHRFLARTPCLLALAQLDDWCGETEPVNVPGTSHEYPNWRRKLSLTLEQLLDSLHWAFAQEDLADTGPRRLRNV